MNLSLRKSSITLLMLIIGILFLFPFFWMISASFKQETEVFNFPIEWIPTHWNAVQNYTQVWLKTPFAQYYGNSILVSVSTTALSVFISCMAAYGFTKVHFKGREVIFLILLVVYMIPHQAILVPQFIIFRWLGLYDTHIGLIFLNCFSVLGTFLLRQAFLSINDEFIESARMDGAGHFRIFTSVIVPLVKPVVATYAILRFIWTWNDYQNPLIFLNSKHLFTLQLGIQSFGNENGQFYSLVMAGAVSAILPLLIVFIIGQKHVIEGISAGGVKG
ncbi:MULTISPECIES: carbohydrate ABC transporter permease [unclassified Paenibacillus]|uniref:carbohydrate ABC transporter permease n=1 Tax=unclassified Paenibacillus TaxID=185978 RepID=UPI00096ED95B|nr:carbohydrate ABC transporter permease [Paenibacillus sp. FSL H7-0331]OMF04760.1 sugar ABC transporter ATP-binding protein [Paenibacillus sp. FSL H7-0331]